jgi:O-antigen biosynthesis protein
MSVELAGPLHPVSLERPAGQRYASAAGLVTCFGQPLGMIHLALDGAEIPAALLADEIWRQLGPEINTRLQGERLPAVTRLPSAGLSILGQPASMAKYGRFVRQAPRAVLVIPTRNRPDRLRDCLRMAVAQSYPDFKIIVVDSASTAAAASENEQICAGHANVRFIRESQPGLSRARNRGLAEVDTDYVAFLDDDLIFDPLWLGHIMHAFQAAPDTVCVTGLILPRELDTQSQKWMEDYVVLGKGFTRRVFDLADNRPQDGLFPYTTGKCGSGASQAYVTTFLRKIGGFDEYLGAGTPAMGGEDLAMYFDVLTHGHRIVYEPAAVVYHPHPREYETLQRQMYSYGVGLTAYLSRCIAQKPSRLFDIARRVPRGLRFAVDQKARKSIAVQTDYPGELSKLEQRGMLYGPLAYLRSRWRLRKLKPAFQP